MVNLFLFCYFRQWREIGEGVYNQDVKELLVDMCSDVLELISQSVIRNIQETGIHTFRRPLSHGQLKEQFQCDLQAIIKSTFQKALQEFIGFDIPVRLSVLFEEAMLKDVVCEVNTALSV